MSNSYFQFKQFRIEQDACAMKVSTDACIQGAWTRVMPGVRTLLDIGTGTGLLSLMLAQKRPGLCVDAVEIEPAAAAQAAANMQQAAGLADFRVLCADIRELALPGKYDLIVCNPPFFHRSLRGPDAARNKARHTDTLSQRDLLSVLKHYLSDKGSASVLLPWAEYLLWESQLPVYGFYVQARLHIRSVETARAGRVVGILGKEPAVPTEETLVIYAAPGQYTEQFKALLAPYYLHL